MALRVAAQLPSNFAVVSGRQWYLTYHTPISSPSISGRMVVRHTCCVEPPTRGISLSANDGTRSRKVSSLSGPSLIDTAGRNTASNSWWYNSSRISRQIMRDLRMAKVIGHVLAIVAGISARNDTVAAVVQKNARKHPAKLAIVTDDSQMTFSQLEDYSSKVASVFSRLGSFKEKDTVALFGTSSPEYVGLWLGLSKLQVSTALLNCNSMGDALLHSIQVVNAKALLVDTNLMNQFNTIRAHFPEQAVFYYNPNLKSVKPPEIPADKWLNSLISETPPLVTSKQKADLEDVLLYIYTSGTTGLPKACIIKQRRFMTYYAGMKACNSIRRSDIIYCPLPVYHTSAGILTLSQTLIGGSTIVLRKKFSAKEFWSDIVQYRCTVFTYIGEMCRFLLAQPASDFEKKHHIRTAFGQGLRPALWDEFAKRFQLGDIREVYGATETNAGMTNMFGKRGAMGYLSPFLARFIPAQIIVPIDRQTGKLIPLDSGLYRETRPGEVGELMGPITNNPLRKFDGYTDRKAASSKIVENVLKKGDKYFRTGDIVVRDEENFVYFVDRIGDSFRWRGENVSTNEVEMIISKLWNHADIVVYGVEIPGCEGRAGMMCVASGSGSWKIEGAYRQLAQHLPSYAIPLFIRVADAIDLTSTMKISRFGLQKEGFSHNNAKGHEIYYLDPSTKAYKIVTPEIDNEISSGRIKF